MRRSRKITYGRTALAPSPLRLHFYLHVAEKALLMKGFQSEQPQVFILGLPRSGTTLIYQYIVHRLKVAYFTNGVGTFPLAPCISTFLQYAIHQDYHSDFKSNYGKVSGPMAPREAGGFWGRFFGTEEYIYYKDMTPKDINLLRSTVACVQHIFGDVPFVNKNVKHMLRIEPLSITFPNAHFLCVERNLEDTALSVLRGRYQNLNNPNKWWSVKPPNYAELKNLSLIEQVACQLITLQERMEADLSEIPANRVLRVHYGEFCRNPEHLVRTLNGVLKMREYRNPPVPSFQEVSNEPETVEEKQLVNLVRSIKPDCK